MLHFETKHAVLLLAIPLLIAGWTFLARRLPGAFGKPVGTEVEIVPTVGLWLEATLMPLVFVAMVGLLAAVAVAMPEFRTPWAALVALLWTAGIALGVSAIGGIRAVRRHRIRYDSHGLSFLPSPDGERIAARFDQIDQLEWPWIGRIRLSVAGHVVPIVSSAGGSRQLLQFVEQELLSRETDRVPG